MARGALIRLGLFQLGAGAVSVLLLGVLNRVLRVELGLDLLLIGVVLGGAHYLGAFISIPFGYFSDRNPIRGLHRVPYIVAGVIVVALALAAAPYVGRALAAQSGPGRVAAAFVFFLVEGLGTYIAGTAYLALITDLTEKDERGRAVAFVWTLLMVGIMLGVFYTAVVLRTYSFATLALAFAAAALTILVLSFVAIWRQERPGSRQSAPSDSVSFRTAVRMLARSRQSRLFFAFLVVGLFAMFMQDILLEPFGGEVLSLSVRSTSLFNAYMMVGLLAAMWYGSARLIPRFGKPWVTVLGAWVQVLAFGLLATTALLQQAWIAAPAITVLGAGMGWFTVGAISLMMDMTESGHTGLFVGAWTLAQALARGPASVAASGLHDLFAALGANPSGAYAAVFVLEAVGLAVAVWLLGQVGAPRLHREVTRLSAVITHTVD